MIGEIAWQAKFPGQSESGNRIARFAGAIVRSGAVIPQCILVSKIGRGLKYALSEAKTDADALKHTTCKQLLAGAASSRTKLDPTLGITRTV